MLNDIIIVESAVSAFNNAALWMPAFLWWSLLALPLFVVIFLCADINQAGSSRKLRRGEDFFRSQALYILRGHLPERPVGLSAA